MNRADRWTMFYAAAMGALLTRRSELCFDYALNAAPGSPNGNPDGENNLMEDAARLADHSLEIFDGWVALQEADCKPDPFAASAT